MVITIGSGRATVSTELDGTLAIKVLWFIDDIEPKILRYPVSTLASKSARLVGEEMPPNEVVKPSPSSLLADDTLGFKLWLIEPAPIADEHLGFATNRYVILCDAGDAAIVCPMHMKLALIEFNNTKPRWRMRFGHRDFPDSLDIDMPSTYNVCREVHDG